MRKPPIVLSIAGSDSCGGAGIQADIRAITALGGYAMTAVTCTTAQHHAGVDDVFVLPAAHISAQIKAVLDHFDVAAVKTGMLFSADIISAVAQSLSGFAGPIVCDPVMVARSGAVLLQADAITAYETRLFPMAAVITPNMAEAKELGGHTAEDLYKKYRTPVIVKQSGPQHADVYCDENGPRNIGGPRVDGVNTHGTGCTFGAALATHMAMGDADQAAAQKAKAHVYSALSSSVLVGARGVLQCEIT